MGASCLALYSATAFAAPGKTAEASSLRILARYSLSLGATPEREAHWHAADGEKRVKIPQGVAPAFDIRWASDDSVYVARADDGIWELALGAGPTELTPRRQLVPDTRTLGRFDGYEHLAASSSHLVFASSAWSLAWRPLDRDKKEREGTVRFDRKEICVTTDLDLQGDRLLLLGNPCGQDNGETWAGHGAIAWLGTLGKHLDDLTPVLGDSAGPAATHLQNCGILGIGAARFLADGSFLVVPGFQPGATLFNAAGQPVRTWTGPETGLDTDCGDLHQEPGKDLAADPSARLDWLNRHRVLEDVLPLAEGPGLLIRFLGQDKKIHWELRVLGPQGSRTVEIPLSSDGLAAHLRGDVRQGRIVLLLSHYFPFMDGTKAGEILVAEISSSPEKQ